MHALEVFSFRVEGQDIAREDNVAVGVVPVPERLTECGEPEALVEMLTDADFAPAVVGEKVTLIMQLAPAASDDRQEVLGAANSAAFVPVREMLLMLSVAVPELMRVTD